MLTVEQLSFSFPGKKILDSVSVEFSAGAITCLLGGNGAGKTTFLNLITGFLRPQSGSVRLADTELVGRAAFSVSRLGVARTFQDLRLIGRLSVRENLLLALPQNSGEQLTRALLPPRVQRERDAADLRKAGTLLSDYFLEEVADRLASEISYGQQKLLTLACCAAMDAKLFLLDEPVAGISPENRTRIAERLASLKARGKTILLIEHQPDFLERTGNEFLFLQGGLLSRFDSFAALRASPMASDALN